MRLADDGSLVQHLVIDQLLKFGIVVVAIVALAIGMAVIWRRAGRR